MPSLLVLFKQMNLEDALVAGEGLGEDRTNDAADRSSAPGKEEHGRRESERREETEGGDEPEAVSG